MWNHIYAEPGELESRPSLASPVLSEVKLHGYILNSLLGKVYITLYMSAVKLRSFNKIQESHVAMRGF